MKHHNDKTITREQKANRVNKKVILISDESEVDEEDSGEESDEPEDESLDIHSPSESDDDGDQDFGAVKVNGIVKQLPQSNFICDYCNSSFKAKQGLTRHVQSHINLSVPWKCDLVGCDFAVSSKIKLNLHKLDVHCVPIAKTDSAMKKALMKRPLQTQKALACFCGASFPTPFSLRAHKNRMHGRKNKCIYGCVNVQYVKSGHFLRHIQFKHPEKLEECLKQTDGYLTKFNSALMNDTKIEILNCDNCDFKTLKKSALKVHIQTHLPDVERSKFECKKCHKLFTRATSLRIHEMTHEDTTIRKTNSLKSISAHYKQLSDRSALLHGKVKTKKFRCSICDRSFLKRFALQCHQRRAHKLAPQVLIVSALTTAKIERRFKCHCGKCFPYKSRLIKHQLRHGTSDDPDVTEKVFKCPELGCNHSFTQRCNLIRHQKAKQHLNAEEIENLKYTCSCGQKFFSVRGFAFHTDRMKCKN